MEEKEIIKQLEEKKKLPKEIKDKILNQTCDCIISAIIVYVYFIFLKLGAKNIHQNIYLVDLKVFSMSLAILSIIFFEHAYNKKSAKSLYRGIEVLGIAIITLLLQYFIVYLTPNYRIMIPVFAILYNIYFIIKALIIIYKMKSEYTKKLSDVKEIVKK